MAILSLGPHVPSHPGAAAATTTTTTTTTMEKTISAGASRPWWCLVWCHERCHKTEVEAQWQALSDCVEEANGTLMRFKKAVGFEKWLEQTPPEMPLALLADWRETKPCVQILLRTTFRSSHITLVYTESQKQYSLASKWAQLVPAEMRSRVSLAPLAADSQAVVKLATEALRKQPLSLKLSALLEDAEEREAAKGQELWQTQGRLLPADLVSGEGVANPETTNFMQMQSGLWTKPVSEVMKSIVLSASSSQVSDMLTAALPDLYGD